MVDPNGSILPDTTTVVWDCHRTAEKRPGVVPEGSFWGGIYYDSPRQVVSGDMVTWSFRRVSLFFG